MTATVLCASHSELPGIHLWILARQALPPLVGRFMTRPL
jgi:hypothetical protein